MTPSYQENSAGQDQAAVAAGSRFKCEKCGSEAIVLQAGPAQLTCCDAPLVKTFDGASRA